MGVDDEYSRAMFAEVAQSARRNRIGAVPVALDRPIASGISFRAGKLIDADGFFADFADVPTLPGDHNAQNAACAWAACRWLRISREEIVKGLKTYPGLPHRQERVAALGQVTYVNDSKATNADAARQALSSYPKVYWIAGGQAKAGGIESLADLFGGIAKAYLVGEAQDEFAATLDRKVPYARCGTMDAAVQAAFADARASGEDSIVLLSPACASFDQFRDYEARGDAFRVLVEALP
jgi:UDP-N-acetylmuramoylalanine--D-glutamate ligase